MRGERGELTLGPLERRVLELLWGRAGEASVRDVCESIPDLAYTTLMTTLDRLHRKGLLSRRRAGRAFHYRTRVSRLELERLEARAFETLLAPGAEPASLRPVLSYFVEAVESRDQALLDELERLVRARRRAARRSR
jgi:predicted transcriptional regulator